VLNRRLQLAHLHTVPTTPRAPPAAPPPGTKTPGPSDPAPPMLFIPTTVGMSVDVIKGDPVSDIVFVVDSGVESARGIIDNWSWTDVFCK